ncbi:unnamed protein product [Rangifer tarandus platyrhynchus]|uniref:Uncharacterized protein n=1 Tax=Rangifer tarandus platyrhynchus TaxID=3082113 RepID=A0AC60A9U3_RANTA
MRRAGAEATPAGLHVDHHPEKPARSRTLSLRPDPTRPLSPCPGLDTPPSSILLKSPPHPTQGQGRLGSPGTPRVTLPRRGTGFSRSPSCVALSCWGQGGGPLAPEWARGGVVTGEAPLSAVAGSQSMAGSGCRLLRRPAPEARPFPRSLQKAGACWEPAQAPCSLRSGALWSAPFRSGGVSREDDWKESGPQNRSYSAQHPGPAHAGQALPRHQPDR